MSDVFYIVNDVKVDPNGKPLADQKQAEKSKQEEAEKSAQRGKPAEKKDT